MPYDLIELDEVLKTTITSVPSDCDVCKHKNACPTGKIRYAGIYRYCNQGIFERE